LTSYKKGYKREPSRYIGNQPNWDNGGQMKKIEDFMRNASWFFFGAAVSMGVAVIVMRYYFGLF
jgi:hypothetical protein